MTVETLFQSSTGLNESGATPFYHLVPKTVEENLRFRRGIINLGCESEENAREIWIMCSRDILFLFNTFFWTFDPRKVEKGEYPLLPFLTYPFQDDLLLDMEGSLGNNDRLYPKSRGMGLSWCSMGLWVKRFVFHDMEALLAASRKESLVDERDNTKSLFWKVEFLLKNLPRFLRPNFTHSYSNMLFINHNNGSTIEGDSTTGDMFRGGRGTGMIIDEAAFVGNASEVLKATRDVTNSRFFISTHNGSATSFNRLIKKGDIKSVPVHWSQHPDWSRGLYRITETGYEIIDKSYVFPPHYDFLDQRFTSRFKLRSPWFNHECKRAETERDIAQELEMDPQASAALFFSSEKVEAARAFTREPLYVGEIDFTKNPVECCGFVKIENGSLRLWSLLNAHGEPNKSHHYAVSADICAGGGGPMGSNTVISIGCMETQEKVGEWCSPEIMPHEAALVAVAICQFFGGASLIWEANGNGGVIFGKTVIEAGYRNFYYRKNESTVTRKATETPGFFTTKDTKASLLGGYRRDLGTNFINPSDRAVEECYEYILLPDGRIVHASSVEKDDPTGAGESHGDFVIADALLWLLLKEGREVKTPEPTIPKFSFAARLKEHRRITEESSKWRI